MKLMLIAVLLSGCGGATTTAMCGDVPGQDCGPTYSVLMKYGPCSITEPMPAQQFHYAVKPTYQPVCRSITSQSATAWTIDCTGLIPPGCSESTCAWVPPILH